MQSRSPTIHLQLDPHAHFIYELALARLELRAFECAFEPTATLKSFRGTRTAHLEKLQHRTAYITEIDGIATDYDSLRNYNRTKSINQYLTHWFYPYKGKFHPQMVRALLNIMQLGPEDTVLDPFIGSGTTAVEAQLLGLHCIGVDISPICTLVTRVKTESIRIIDRVQDYEGQYDVIARTAARSKAQAPQLGLDISDDERLRNFFRVAELIAHSDETRRGATFTQSFVRNIKRMSFSVEDMLAARENLSLTLGTIDIGHGDARKLILPDTSVDGILTSPPYGVTLDYVENDAHAFRALGYTSSRIRENFVGLRGPAHQRMELYVEDIRQCYVEMFRVLRPGRWCVIIIGNGKIGSRRIDLIDLTIQLCTEIGFEFVREIEKPIRGRQNEMRQESIVMFIKPAIFKL